VYEREIGVENVKATLATPDQRWTDIWKLNEHEASTVLINLSKLRIREGDESNPHLSSMDETHYLSGGVLGYSTCYKGISRLSHLCV